MNRFDYVKYDNTAIQQQEAVKKMIADLAEMVEKEIIPGRATSLAITKLEEAYMWIGKAIRDDQLGRDGTYEIQK